MISNLRSTFQLYLSVLPRVITAIVIIAICWYISFGTGLTVYLFWLLFSLSIITGISSFKRLLFGDIAPAGTIVFTFLFYFLLTLSVGFACLEYINLAKITFIFTLLPAYCASVLSYKNEIGLSEQTNEYHKNRKFH